VFCGPAPCTDVDTPYAGCIPQEPTDPTPQPTPAPTLLEEERGQDGIFLLEGNEETPQPFGTIIIEPMISSIDEQHKTYRIKVILDSRAQNVYALAGIPGHSLIVPAAYQVPPPFGANYGGVNTSFFSFNAAAEFDSWLTIGTTDENNSDALSIVGTDFNSWTETSGIDVSDGALFFMNPGDGPSREDYPDGIVLAQLTFQNVPDSHYFSGVLQGRSPGDGEDWKAVFRTTINVEGFTVGSQTTEDTLEPFKVGGQEATNVASSTTVNELCESGYTLGHPISEQMIENYGICCKNIEGAKSDGEYICMRDDSDGSTSLVSYDSCMSDYHFVPANPDNYPNIYAINQSFGTCVINTDCVVEETDCTSNCEKTITIRIPSSGLGTPCPDYEIRDGFNYVTCNRGEGECGRPRIEIEENEENNRMNYEQSLTVNCSVIEDVNQCNTTNGCRFLQNSCTGLDQSDLLLEFISRIQDHNNINPENQLSISNRPRLNICGINDDNINSINTQPNSIDNMITGDCTRDNIIEGLLYLYDLEHNLHVDCNINASIDSCNECNDIIQRLNFLRGNDGIIQEPRGDGLSCEVVIGEDCTSTATENCNTDCNASWSVCSTNRDNGNCEKTYNIEQGSTESNCPFNQGETQTCIPGTDECDIIQDCVGDWGECTTECEKTFIITTDPSETGNSCLFNSGEKASCFPGEGDCPDISDNDCELNIPECTSDCEESSVRRANSEIIQYPQGNGITCNDINIPDCQRGQGQCPCPTNLNEFDLSQIHHTCNEQSTSTTNCSGEWGACDQTTCQKTYNIIEDASPDGLNCPFSNGESIVCVDNQDCNINNLISMSEVTESVCPTGQDTCSEPQQIPPEYIISDTNKCLNIGDNNFNVKGVCATGYDNFVCGDREYIENCSSVSSDDCLNKYTVIDDNNYVKCQLSHNFNNANTCFSKIDSSTGGTPLIDEIPCSLEVDETTQSFISSNSSGNSYRKLTNSSKYDIYKSEIDPDTHLNETEFINIVNNILDNYTEITTHNSWTNDEEIYQNGCVKNYGSYIDNITKCEEMCDKHDECVGFQHYTNNHNGHHHCCIKNSFDIYSDIYSEDLLNRHRPALGIDTYYKIKAEEGQTAHKPEISSCNSTGESYELSGCTANTSSISIPIASKWAENISEIYGSNKIPDPNAQCTSIETTDPNISINENNLHMTNFDVEVYCNNSEICGNREYVSNCNGLSKDDALNSYTKDENGDYIKCQQGDWYNNGNTGVSYNNMIVNGERVFDKIYCNTNSYEEVNNEFIINAYNEWTDNYCNQFNDNECEREQFCIFSDGSCNANPETQIENQQILTSINNILWSQITHTNTPRNSRTLDLVQNSSPSFHGNLTKCQEACDLVDNCNAIRYWSEPRWHEHRCALLDFVDIKQHEIWSSDINRRGISKLYAKNRSRCDSLTAEHCENSDYNCRWDTIDEKCKKRIPNPSATICSSKDNPYNIDSQCEVPNIESREVEVINSFIHNLNEYTGGRPISHCLVDIDYPPEYGEPPNYYFADGGDQLNFDNNYINCSIGYKKQDSTINCAEFDEDQCNNENNTDCIWDNKYKSCLYKLNYVTDWNDNLLSENIGIHECDFNNQPFKFNGCVQDNVSCRTGENFFDFNPIDAGSNSCPAGTYLENDVYITINVINDSREYVYHDNNCSNSLPNECFHIERNVDHLNQRCIIPNTPPIDFCRPNKCKIDPTYYDNLSDKKYIIKQKISDTPLEMLLADETINRSHLFTADEIEIEPMPGFNYYDTDIQINCNSGTNNPDDINENRYFDINPPVAIQGCNTVAEDNYTGINSEQTDPSWLSQTTLNLECDSPNYIISDNPNSRSICEEPETDIQFINNCESAKCNPISSIIDSNQKYIIYYDDINDEISAVSTDTSEGQGRRNHQEEIIGWDNIKYNCGPGYVKHPNLQSINICNGHNQDPSLAGVSCDNMCPPGQIRPIGQECQDCPYNQIPNDSKTGCVFCSDSEWPNENNKDQCINYPNIDIEIDDDVEPWLIELLRDNDNIEHRINTWRNQQAQANPEHHFLTCSYYEEDPERCNPDNSNVYANIARQVCSICGGGVPDVPEDLIISSNPGNWKRYKTNRYCTGNYNPSIRESAERNRNRIFSQEASSYNFSVNSEDQCKAECNRLSDECESFTYREIYNYLNESTTYECHLWKNIGNEAPMRLTRAEQFGGVVWETPQYTTPVENNQNNLVVKKSYCMVKNNNNDIVYNYNKCQGELVPNIDNTECICPNNKICSNENENCNTTTCTGQANICRSATENPENPDNLCTPYYNDEATCTSKTDSSGAACQFIELDDNGCTRNFQFKDNYLKESCTESGINCGWDQNIGTECICPPDKVETQDGTDCICPSGEVENDDGECVCPAGKYRNSGSCASCPSGTYKSDIGNQACDSCSSDDWRNQGTGCWQPNSTRTSCVAGPLSVSCARCSGPGTGGTFRDDSCNTHADCRWDHACHSGVAGGCEPGRRNGDHCTGTN